MLVEFCDLSVRTPLDPVLPLTSLMDRLPGCLLFVVLSTFCGSQCGSLIFCCCYTYVSAVLVLCRPRVSIVLWCWWCWFLCIWSFLLSGPVICVFCSCVKLVSAGPMKGRLDFFEKNVRCVYKWTMRLRVNECAMRLWDEWTMRLNKWMYDAFMEWMDDAFMCVFFFFFWVCVSVVVVWIWKCHALMRPISTAQ